MKKIGALALIFFLPSFCFAKIETYENPKNVSAACVSKILSAVEKNPSTRKYVPKNAHASLEWWDNDENEMYLTVTDRDDSYATLTARFAIKKTGNGNCSVGKLIDWDFAS